MKKIKIWILPADISNIFRNSIRKGKTPITKNIAVLDCAENPLVPTYAKRAKQLVKKGRAKWIGSSAIQLTVSSEDAYLLGSSFHIYEEDIMSDNNQNSNSNSGNPITVTPFLSKEASGGAAAVSVSGNEYLQLLNKIAEESSIASKALDMLANISDDTIKGENMQVIVQAYETTRQTVAKEISKLMAISVAGTGSNVVGKFEKGGTDKKILEYYLTHGSEDGIGFPEDRGGSEYVHKHLNGSVQDFNGGDAGRCLIMSSRCGAFLLKDPFHDGYWSGNSRNTLCYPTTDQYQNGSVIQQDFEGGFMTYDPEDDEVSIFFKSKR